MQIFIPSGHGAFDLGSGAAAGSGTLSMSSPVPYTVVQRNGSNQGAFSIAGLCTFASTCHVEASTDNFATATRIATVAAGTNVAYSGTLSGVTAGPRVTLRVRLEEDHATAASVASVAVGENVLIVGDSRVSPLYTNAQTYLQTSIGCSQLANDGLTWYDSNDAVNAKRNTWVIRYCDLLAQQLNMAVGCSIQNAGGTDIGSADRWSTTALDLWPTVITRLGAFAWGHVQMEFGPNGFAYHLTEAQYTALCGLQTAFIAANVPGAPTKVFWEICGESANEPTGSWKTNYRNGILDHVALNLGGYVGAVIIDEEYSESDHIHPESDAHANEIGNRASLSVKGIVSGTGSAVRGPRVSQITRSGANIDVRFNQSLGNAVSSALTAAAFSVTDGGSATTISSVIVLSATTARIILSAVPTGVVLVSFAKGDTAVAATVPVSANQLLADSTSIQIPAEPFLDVAVTAAVTAPMTPACVGQPANASSYELVMA